MWFRRPVEDDVLGRVSKHGAARKETSTSAKAKERRRKGRKQLFFSNPATKQLVTFTADTKPDPEKKPGGRNLLHQLLTAGDSSWQQINRGDFHELRRGRDYSQVAWKDVKTSLVSELAELAQEDDGKSENLTSPSDEVLLTNADLPAPEGI